MGNFPRQRRSYITSGGYVNGHMSDGSDGPTFSKCRTVAAMGDGRRSSDGGYPLPLVHGSDGPTFWCAQNVGPSLPWKSGPWQRRAYIFKNVGPSLPSEI